jgi:hypothetical protein
MKTNILVKNKTRIVALDKATQRELLEAKSNTLATIKKWEDRVAAGMTLGTAGVIATMKNHLSSIVVEIASRVGKKAKA